jgi:hypothetical protein
MYSGETKTVFPFVSSPSSVVAGESSEEFFSLPAGTQKRAVITIPVNRKMRASRAKT